MSRKSIDHALLMALGLSAEEAEFVMDEIDRLRAAVLSENAHLEQMTMAANQLHKELADEKAHRAVLERTLDAMNEADLSGEL